MTAAATIHHVQHTLHRTHALFTPAADTGEQTARNAGATLAGLATATTVGGHAMRSTSGETTEQYRTLAEPVAATMHTTAEGDLTLSQQLRAADHINRAAAARSSRILSGAEADIAALHPYLDTPAGQHALLITLRGRIADQRQLLETTHADSERLTGQMHTTTYNGKQSPLTSSENTTRLSFGPRNISPQSPPPQSPPPPPDPAPLYPSITGPAPLQDFTNRQLQGQPVPSWEPAPPPATGDPIKLPPVPNPVTVINTNAEPGPVDLFPRCDGGDTAKAATSILMGMLGAVVSVAGTAPTLGTSLLGLGGSSLAIGSGIDDLYNCK